MEYLSPKQKQDIKNHNKALQIKKERNEEINKVRKDIKKIKNTFTPPSKLEITGMIVKKITGEDPLTIIYKSGIKTMENRTKRRNAMKKKFRNIF